MATIPYPLINGVRHDWSSIELKIGVQIFKGFTEVKYQDSLKGAWVYGNHPQPIGQTRGVYEASGSMTLILAEANEFLKALGKGFKEKFFNLSVSYSESWYETITDEIIGCKITDTEGGGSQGPDGLVRTFPMTVQKVLWNGLDSLESPLTGA